MQLVRWRSKRAFSASLYATLLVGYVLLLISADRGESERGLVRIIEYSPIVILSVHMIRPAKLLWWLMAVAAGLYGIELAVVFARLGYLMNGDLRRVLAWMWFTLVIWLTRPVRSVSAAN